jgi:hypothetical protein
MPRNGCELDSITLVKCNNIESFSENPVNRRSLNIKSATNDFCSQRSSKRCFLICPPNQDHFKEKVIMQMKSPATHLCLVVPAGVVCQLIN